MTDNDYGALWVLPPGVTLQQAQANPGAEFAFPQTLTTTGTLPCGSVIQDDVYDEDPAAVTADGILSWVNGRPEDADIYVSHTFFETEACVVVTPSPSPSPSPSPEPSPEPSPTPTPPVVVTEIGTPAYSGPQLAETGFDPALIGYLALMAVLGGVVLLAWKRSKR